MIVVLDSIRSAHNVGSILRTADAVGVSKVYLCGLTPAPLDRFGRVNQRVTKVSLGAEHSVTWESVPEILALLTQLKTQGFNLIALEQHPKSIRLLSFKPPTSAALEKTVLILGPEVTGLSPALLKLCDQIVEIPMRGKKESLNVAVSFGIVAYWFSQKELV
jgi:23S rRNA (guanosine2251-2'-O)-methyltransferase